MIPELQEEEERIISTLAHASHAAIARVNYRASSVHQYPTPIHDTLLAYDWIKDNLLQNAPATVGVCGELVGASLAVTLGLTECHRGQHRVGAVAVNNPIVDWVFADDLPTVPVSELPEPLAPEETAFPADEDPMSLNQVASEPQKSSKRPAKPPAQTAWQLHADNPILPTVTLSAERDALFRKPEHFFDRFASPIHMFRSPRGTLIYPQSDDSFASQLPEFSLDLETQMDLNHYQTLDTASPAPLELPTLIRCRAYARFYPPAGFHLDLPIWHVTVGEESPLMDQASELSKLLKRNIARQTLKNTTGRARWHDDAEKAKYESFADGRVQLATAKGAGLWTWQEPDSTWKEDVEKVGSWMKEQLKPPF